MGEVPAVNTVVYCSVLEPIVTSGACLIALCVQLPRQDVQHVVPRGFGAVHTQSPGLPSSSPPPHTMQSVCGGSPNFWQEHPCQDGCREVQCNGEQCWKLITICVYYRLSYNLSWTTVSSLVLLHVYLLFSSALQV